MSNLTVSVVLGSFNRYYFLKETINNLRKELKGIENEIIVVDGGSNDKTIPWLIKQKDVITIIQHNSGYWDKNKIEKKPWGYFMNLAFKAASGKFMLMVSDDCLLIPNSIKNGIIQFEKLLQENKKIGALAFNWRDWPKDTHYAVHNVFGVNYVNHGLYLSEALKKVNYIDDKTYSFYCADIDLCLKLTHEGFECEIAENSYCEHFENATINQKLKNESNAKKDYNNLINKWKTKFDTEKGGIKILKEYVDLHKTGDNFKKPALIEKYPILNMIYS